MRNTFVLSLVLLLSACAVDTQAPTAPVMATPPKAVVNLIKSSGSPSAGNSALDARGEQALQLLQRWYNDTTVDCGSGDKPAYLCSGVWLRLTTTSLAYFPWDPSPGAIIKGGLSFAWLRQDQTFTGVVVPAQNGLLFYPNDEAPAGKYPVETLCTFPRDANTWDREKLQGCGPSRINPAITAPCQALGVLTAEEWVKRYGGNTPLCGWDLRPTAQTPSQWFNASMLAHQSAPDPVWAMNNELIVTTWKTGSGARLPLVAFFYLGDGLADEFAARTNAWVDQTRYYREFGQALPIIRVALPKTRDQAVTFTYAAADQALEPGGQVLRADFEDAAIGGHKRVSSKGVDFFMSGPDGEVRDDPLPTPLIKDRYAVAKEAISFGVKEQGPVRVTFNWGCNDYCQVAESLSGKEVELSPERPEQMRFGTYSVTVTGPEHLTLSSAGDDESLMVIDNVKIEPLKASSAR